MVSKKVKVTAPVGLHLRPAGILCKQAMQFESDIEIWYQGTKANAKSVLSVLSACVKYNGEIELKCMGPDEEEALAAMVEIIENGLE